MTEIDEGKDKVSGASKLYRRRSRGRLTVPSSSLPDPSPLSHVFLRPTCR